MEMLANNQYKQKLVMGLNELRIFILMALVKIMLIFKYFCSQIMRKLGFPPPPRINW